MKIDEKSTEEIQELCKTDPEKMQSILDKLPSKIKARMYVKNCTIAQINGLIDEFLRRDRIKDLKSLKKELIKRKKLYLYPVLSDVV